MFDETYFKVIDESYEYLKNIIELFKQLKNVKYIKWSPFIPHSYDEINVGALNVLSGVY